MFRIFPSVSLAAVILPLLAVTASAEVLGNVKVPIKTFIVTGCGNVADPIEVTGVSHFVATSQVNVNRTSLIFHGQFNMEGRDAYGNQYNVADNTTTVTNVRTDSLQVPYTITINFYLRAIGKGGAQDFWLSGKQHVTVNPNGTVTASFSELGAKCK